MLLSHFFVTSLTIYVLGPGKVDSVYHQKLFKRACGWELRSYFIFHYITAFSKKIIKSHSKICKEGQVSKLKIEQNSNNEIIGSSVWSDAGGDNKLQINFAWPKNLLKYVANW